MENLNIGRINIQIESAIKYKYVLCISRIYLLYVAFITNNRSTYFSENLKFASRESHSGSTDIKQSSLLP